jgi:glutamine amidotransferase
VAAIRHGNVWGTQFHPEKSHKFGLALMRAFIERI